jgi:hypothetical protein
MKFIFKTTHNATCRHSHHSGIFHRRVVCGKKADVCVFYYGFLCLEHFDEFRRNGPEFKYWAVAVPEVD